MFRCALIGILLLALPAAYFAGKPTDHRDTNSNGRAIDSDDLRTTRVLESREEEKEDEKYEEEKEEEKEEEEEGEADLYRVTLLQQFYSQCRESGVKFEAPSGPTCMKEAPVESVPSGTCHPQCEEGKGCDSPLNCFDFRTLGERSVVPDPPKAVEVTPYRLAEILEDPATANCCAVVMFYAPWCEYSVQFARRFNTLGRAFPGLPFLAMDFSKHEPHKYVLAYLPVVAFYYRARVLFKFKLTTTYDELKDSIANITGFTPMEVNSSDEESESPVPVQRDSSDRYFLYLAVWWLAFVTLVCGLRSSRVTELSQRVLARIWREKVD